jgi:predicted transcriptional regulator
MKLDEYLEKGKMKPAEFSKKSGIDLTTVRNIIRGYDIKLSTALKVQEFTHGLVRCEDLAPIKKRESKANKSESQKVAGDQDAS